jgi:MFS transporter, DHA1 family, multidrug resistance protein
LGLFAFASIMLVFTHSVTELIIWRVLQAFGGGWSAVSVPAIVRDRVEGQEAAKLFSLIAIIMIVAPTLAPTIGSVILLLGSWRGIFVFIALYSLVVMVLLKLFIFNSKDPPRKRPTSHHLGFFSSYRRVLKNKVAIYLILLQSFAFSTLLIYLTHASFIFQKWFGVSTFTFAFLFACNVVMMGLLGITNRILLRWVSSRILLLAGVILQSVAVLMLLLVAFFHSHQLLFFVPALMVTVGAIGIISPNNQACYLQYFKQNSGTAAALMGAFQLALAGCMSALSVFFSDGTLKPTVLMMMACSILSLAAVSKGLLVMRTSKPQIP